MILKTEAIVLRINAFSNTSHIVSWLSPTAGRLSTVIRGACRSKSAFLGQYDLFYTCELLYYTRERNGLHIARECAPLEFRESIRDSWRTSLSAGYVCDVMDRVAEDSPPGGLLYGLLTGALDCLGRNGPSMEALLWFEAGLLSALGLSPDLTGCPSCHSGKGGRLQFSVSDGRVVCERCSPSGGHISVSLGHDSAMALRRAPAQSWDEGPFGGLSRAELLSLKRFLGVFMRYHLDVPLESRAIAWSIWV